MHPPMTPPLPPKHATNRDAALWIVRRLRHAGHDAYFAGGCVRDQLLRRRPSDHDVATEARPEQVIRLFRRTRAVGKQFGVVLVGVQDHWIEVATWRTDSTYTDGRHPDSIAYGTAEQDAQRRDFTINGMFYDPLARRVIDYVGGRRDLRARTLRAIGDPETRFAEDHLRLLRAVRFAARMQFRIERKTWDAMIRHAPQLARVSAERIGEELASMMTAPTRAIAWDLLHRGGLVPHLWKGADRLAARADHIAPLLAALPKAASFELVLAAWSLPDADETDRICLALKTSNQMRTVATWLVRHHADLDDPRRVTPADLKLRMAGPAFGDLLDLLHTRLAARGAPLSAWRVIRRRAAAIAPADVAPPPLLNGHDLASMGLPAGPRYKQVLDRVYYAQLNGELPDARAARDLARRIIDGEGGVTILQASHNFAGKR